MKDTSNTLHISLIQSPLHWESPEANRAMFEEKISLVNKEVDIFILPEMFTTGFTMDAENNAEMMNLHTYKWLHQIAENTGAVVTGSVIIRESNQYYNRLLWMPPDGKVQWYDKKHLFRMADEHLFFSPGESRLITRVKGWKICPLICYDLRFPEWARNRYDPKNEALDYDLLVYVANWPAAREEAWDTLLRARAIENLSYSAGVNRMGSDGNDIFYSGHTSVYDFKGQKLVYSENEEVISISLDMQKLREFREKFPTYLDAK